MSTVFLQQQAFRQELLGSILVIPAGIWLGRTGAERALLVGSWLLILLVELINSAIEITIDRIGLEYNELSRRAKDIGSAAVLGSFILAAAVWALVLTGR